MMASMEASPRRAAPFSSVSNTSRCAAFMQSPNNMPRVRTRSLLSNASSRNVSGGQNLFDGPPSPTLSETTNASQMNFGSEGPEKIITRADLKNSLQAYENLLNASLMYRDAIMHMSRATANLADALETCSSLKGVSYVSGSRLQAASGLHFLMGNQWHVLSDSIDRKFERPLRQHLDNYRATVAERSAAYEKVLRDKSRIIRQTEMENMNVGRKKHRNLQTFREALAVLQRQVEELDQLRVDHYQEILEHEEGVWDFVQGKVSVVLRSTLDVFDRFTAKSSDPVIEPMLQSVPDPFDSYGPPKAEDQIFTILPPLSIMNGPTHTPPGLSIATAQIDSTPVFATENSWGDSSDGPSNALGFTTAEWGDPNATTPTSSPPQSIRSNSSSGTRHTSPPGSLSRRQQQIPFPSVSSSSSTATTSNGPSTGAVPYHGRKSEARLRNVLSVISEGHSQPSSSFMRQRDPSQETLKAIETDTNGVHEVQPDATWPGPEAERSSEQDTNHGSAPAVSSEHS